MNITSCIPTTDHNGNFILSNLEKSNLFNDYFSSVFILDNNQNLSLTDYKGPELKECSFHLYQVYEKLKNLSSKMTVGPDEISPMLLHKLSSSHT